MTHGGFKDISRRNPKYDEYQRVLASVCYTFSEKKKKKKDFCSDVKKRKCVKPLFMLCEH